MCNGGWLRGREFGSLYGTFSSLMPTSERCLTSPVPAHQRQRRSRTPETSAMASRHHCPDRERPHHRRMTDSATAPPRLSIQQARNLHLEAQGLLRKPPARPRRADLLAAIERMQLLQIDTIHVVARSPYLVLFSRLGSYPADWLGEALERGDIFECWSHEACFVPSSAFASASRASRLGGRAGHWAEQACRACTGCAARGHGMRCSNASASKGRPRPSDFDGTQRAKTAGGAGRTKSAGSKPCSRAAN